MRDVLPLAELDVLITPLVAFDAAVNAWGWAAVSMIVLYRTGGSIACSR
ncbi:5-formyltetrahydrofolate cyclo-ligase (plasmid) [Klebsiella aerogenes]|nr:5-formyltetrahydrofolate cyclo-ligase [Klebsiella aerogenes]